MGDLIRRVGPCGLTIGGSGGHLAALVRSIVYQQLSGKAAATIHGRLVDRFAAGTFPEAKAILALRDEDLRQCGLSRQKIAALRDLCRHVHEGGLPLHELDAMSDEAITEALVAVRGIGRWSAEMFLIFHLGRLDVWPIGDLAIQKAMQKLHRLRERPRPKRMEALGERYRPYRSIASWYLWRLMDDGAGEW